MASPEIPVPTVPRFTSSFGPLGTIRLILKLKTHKIMARSGKSKSNAFPNGRRRKLDNGKRKAPRAVRQQTDKEYMEQCDEALVQRLSNIPFDEQTKTSSSW